MITASSEQVITASTENYVRNSSWKMAAILLSFRSPRQHYDSDAYYSVDDTYLICVPLRRVFPLGSTAIEKPVASDSQMCCMSSSLLLEVTTTRLATRKEE